MSDKLPSGEPRIPELIEKSEHVGGIFSMEYDESSILVNDFWTQEAGGLPRHTLLLARPMVEAANPEETEAVSKSWTVPTEDEETDDEGSPVIEDPDHAMLLRVMGPADLPMESRLKTNRHDAIRKTVTSQNGSKPSPEDVADILTRRELQYSGITAKVLGTFYYDEPGENEDIDVDEILRFGSDIQNVFSAGNYTVYKLQNDALSWVSSYPSHRADVAVNIGDIKYTSTQIWGEHDQPSVSIPIDDFIGAKTAVFGMTRKGKSNAMKIIATAIDEANSEIGQLLFDPSGEYAYANEQDEKALGDLGETTQIYKYGAASDSDEEVKPLRSNLMNRENLPIAEARVRQVLADETSDYVRNFLALSPPTVGEIEQEDNYGRKERLKRQHFSYFALLGKQLKVPESWGEKSGNLGWLACKAELVKYLNDEHGTDFYVPEDSDMPMSDENLVEFWETVANNIGDVNQKYKEIDDRGKEWVDEDLRKILKMFSTEGQTGHQKLSEMVNFHNASSDIDSAAEIYQDLADGKIVVVDISYGAEDVVTAETDRITNHIVAESMRQFKNTETPEDELPEIQIYLEEAHQHFEEEKYRDDNSQNPYVKLAKEGAKFNVGMTYATQEVSSIDERVLANTANWIVTHLNSKDEINELASYYNFEDFSDSIRDVEEVGFARLKTYSGEYIIPTKIALFDVDWITANTDYTEDELMDKEETESALKATDGGEADLLSDSSEQHRG